MCAWLRAQLRHWPVVHPSKNIWISLVQRDETCGWSGLTLLIAVYGIRVLITIWIPIMVVLIMIPFKVQKNQITHFGLSQIKKSVISWLTSCSLTPQLCVWCITDPSPSRPCLLVKPTGHVTCPLHFYLQLWSHHWILARLGLIPQM